MKKILSALLSVLVVLSFAFFAVGSSSSDEETDLEKAVSDALENVDVAQNDDLFQNESVEERNARRSAESYLNVSAFSREGLIEQLEFEGYSYESAVYAVDNCGADWFEQAAKSAENYLDLMAFSRSELIEQLEFEGFTHEQAVYGVEANGY